MDHSLCPDEAVGHLPDVAALPLHQDHLKAHVVVQVDKPDDQDLKLFNWNHVI